MPNEIKRSGRLTIKIRFMIIVASVIIGFALFGFVTLKAAKILNVNGTIYQRIVQGKDIIADVLPPPEYIIESYLVVLQTIQTENTTEIETLKKRLEVLKSEYDTRHQYWQDQHLEDELNEPLLKRSYQSALAFYSEAQQSFFPAIQTANREAALVSLQKMQQAYEAHRAVINEVVQLTTERNTEDEAEARNTIRKYGIIRICIFAFSVLVSVALTMLISRGIIRQLGGEPSDVTDLARNIASGKLDNAIAVNPGDSDSLLANMKNMQQQLLERITADRKEHDDAQRIKTALDSISSNVMVADNERNIIYINPAVLAMLQHAESDLRKVLPGFDSSKLLGENMDVFHKNPAHQKELLGGLSSTFRSEITVAAHTFYLVANPINNEHGERLGVVVEWKDRTAEVAIEQEVAKVVSGAVLGDFNQRINEGDKEGFFLQLAQGVNELMETSSTGLNEVVRVLGALSRGDLTETITSDYSGTFGQLKDDSNSTVEKLQEIVGQIKEASETINTAAKEIAAGNNDLSHRTEEQAASLEQTAASMEELTSTVQANSHNAKHANQLAVGAADIAGKGVNVVGQVVSTMEGINESSRKVVDIISVIDSIAFQTNILALNAAVEAARAGEQGRGFAVVAGEVRNLAQRAAAAAAEIKSLIGDSVEKVEEGAKLVAQAGQTMEEIVSAIRGVTVIMSEISAASMEQTSGIEQVNQAIGQMDDVTQQNAALVEQAAAAAESLEEQTQNLAVTVTHFKLDENSRGASSAAQIKVAPARTDADKISETAKPKPQMSATVSGDWEEF